MSRQKRIPTPAWDRDSGLGGGMSASRMQLYAIGLVILLVVAAIGVIGWGFLSDYIEDQQRPGSTALALADKKYSVEDFTERSRMYSTQIGSTNYSFVIPTVISQLEQEAILLKFAGEEGVTVTDDEVKEEIATLLGITKDDPNFDARLQEQLATIKLSEEEYRDIARANALRANMVEKFKTELPATIESVSYRQIVVADQVTADDLKSQIEGGADFAEVAAANSTDTATKDKGGEVGWVPLGYLGEDVDGLLFSLEKDQIITYATSSGVAIYQVTDTDDARAIDEDKKDTLANNSYNDWLTAKEDSLDVTNDMDLASPDIKKIEYVIKNAGLTAQ